MKRGIVMSIHQNHAVVMTADGRFMRTPLRNSLQIGEETVVEEERSISVRRPFARMYRLTGAAAVLLVLIASCLIYVLQQTAPVVAYVTLDINPSVEIGVDKGEKVRQLRALNTDGEQVIHDIAFKGLGVEEVAALIIANARDGHYLDASHKDILVTSIMIDGSDRFGPEFETRMSSKLDERLHALLAEILSLEQDVSVITLSAPAELRAEADANGISSGKMALYLMAKNEGYELELEQLRRQSIDAATESIGGVKQLVESSENTATSKEKLQELLSKEKLEQQKMNAKEGKPAAVIPTSKPIVETVKNNTSGGKKDSGKGSGGDKGKDKEKDKGKDRGKDKDRNDDKRNGRDKEKDKNKDKWRDDGHKGKGEQDRNGGKDKNKVENKNKDKSKDKDKDKNRDKNMIKDRDKGKDKSRDKENNKNNDKKNNDKNNNKDMSKDKGRDKEKDKNKQKIRNQQNDSGGKKDNRKDNRNPRYNI